MTESILRCPGCGAPAQADAQKCSYCDSPLATVTCPSCFAPMFKGSRFCPKCGAEAVRTVVADETPRSCPRCREALAALQLGAVRASECAECGGLWLAPAVLQALCDDREQHNAIVAALAAHAARRTTPADVVTYIPCPVCPRLMNRTNFAHVSGVIVDVCRDHGVWLDRGELERIIQFVEAGGMAKEREHEMERMSDEARHLKAEREALTQGYLHVGPEYVTHRGPMNARAHDESATGVFAALAGLLTT